MWTLGSYKKEIMRMKSVSHQMENKAKVDWATETISGNEDMYSES